MRFEKGSGNDRTEDCSGFVDQERAVGAARDGKTAIQDEIDFLALLHLDDGVPLAILANRRHPFRYAPMHRQVLWPVL